MTKCCKDCKHFTDGRYSKTYISPICIAHGGDDASFFRKYVCGIEEARLWEQSNRVHTAHVGSVPEQDT